MPRHFPDVSLPHVWRCLGMKDGKPVREFFRPDEYTLDGEGNRSWLWVDETIPDSSTILKDAHSPHEYSGYDLHVRKQPVITKFTNHDHLIIPDLDAETPGDQAVSIIVYTDFIWTRHSGNISGLDALFQSDEFLDRASQHGTAVYAFIGILRVMLDSLNRELLRNERQTYAMEDLFLQRERGSRPDFEREGNLVSGDSPTDMAYRDSLTDPLAELRHLPESRQLVELRINIAWHRKQFDAFERVVSALFDPVQGAFHRSGCAVLVDEVQPYFQHLLDQIKRSLAKVEHLRDLHVSLDQLLVAEQAERMNLTLLRLSWISIIFMPIGVIAGFFGMNISLFNDPNHTFGEDSWVAIMVIGFSVMIAWHFYQIDNLRHNDKSFQFMPSILRRRSAISRKPKAIQCVMDSRSGRE